MRVEKHDQVAANLRIRRIVIGTDDFLTRCERFEIGEVGKNGVEE